MRKLAFLVLLTLAVVLVAGAAQAHVTVWPKQSPAGGYERYTIRVPTEKDIPTVKLRVELPPGMTFSAVMPMPGWTFATEKDAAGKATALVWSGGQIAKGEFLEFAVSAKNPAQPGDLTWKAYQTYSDGSVVAWAGAADAKEPAPVVRLTPAAPAPTDHPDTAPAPGTQQPPAARPESASPPAGGTSAGLWLGGAALLISLASLVMSLRKT